MRKREGLSGRLRWLDSAWMSLARRPAACCIAAGLAVVVIRLSILSADPIPEPTFHDEFSYILGGQTLALGRVTNPTHPMWRFFETIQVNMEPTYASKYPPAQAVFLAAGIVLFGHPWYGVVLSVAVMCGSLCWMLQGWVPPRFALLGTVLAVSAFSHGHYWIESYWGGAAAASGGALLLGAVGRLRHRLTAGLLCTAVIGVWILANSRPLEGFAMTVVAVGLLISEGRRSLWARRSSRVFVLPVALFLLAASSMAYYNYRLTGSPVRLAYSLNLERYSKDPVLWVLPPKTGIQQHHYRDPTMESLWDWYLERYLDARSHPFRAPSHVLFSLVTMTGAGAGAMVVASVAYAVIKSRSRRSLKLLAGLGVMIVVLSTESFHFSHYAAPALGLLVVLSMFGARQWVQSRAALGECPVRIIVGGAGFAVLLSLGTMVLRLTLAEPPGENAISFKRRVERTLDSASGQHLVFVRYAADHNIHLEAVYNTPSIDEQKVVWAFDFGDSVDRQLRAYYPDRKVWLMQPDGANPSLEAYPADTVIHP